MLVSRIGEFRPADLDRSPAKEKSSRLGWLKGRLLESSAIVAVAAAVTVGLTSPLRAQTWQNGGVDNGNYNEPTNWTTTNVPDAPGETATFAGTGSTAVVVTAPVGPGPDSWTFTAASQDYSVSGSAVTFSGAGPNLINAGGTNSISNNMTGSAISVTAGQLTVSGTNSFTTTSVTGGTFVNSGSLTSTVTNSATYTNSGTLTGNVTNSGTFSNTGTVTGSVSQSAGTTTNSGTITGTLGLTGGTFTNNIGGDVQGTTTNNGGTVNNNATMAGVV
ncbi:hypothetical protein JQ625_32380, partial [Bradyrhizobium diazoefficiens]|nr:hypothetical protein [Bradyrhizobium diazoefficiens]